jgi:F-type H+-transporting ATPase subunit b
MMFGRSKWFIFLLLVLLPAVVFAEGEGAHEASEIPISVLWQAINFTIYIGILFYYLRHPVRNFFKTRKEAYQQALVRSEQARLAAELKKREIQERLTKLENTSADAVAKAKAEAAQLISQIQQQGDELAHRLRDDAGRVAHLEVERAKIELRTEMLGQAVALSRKLLEDKDKLKDTDQKRLQTEFVTKIQEVR